MSMSLRDQLLAAGLVTKKQVQQTSQQKHQKKNQPGRVDEQKLAAEQARAAKIARDQELNRQQQEKAEKKARSMQVKQLVEQNRLPKVQSFEFYNFVDGKKIRAVEVDAPMRERLSRGELAIVRHEGHYAVVPAAIADRIRERDERAVIPHNVAKTTVDPDDPYKDYVVPDDLIW
jgi:hypothetical protein